MTDQRWNIFWGALAVIAGVLWLLGEFAGYTIPDLAGGVLFLVVALVFTYGLLTDPEAWWAAIPAGALFGLAALIGAVEFIDEDAAWIASLFLGGLALGFLTVFVRAPARWWALIPGGVLLSIATLVAVSESGSDDAIASVLFFGLALTFAALALVRTGEGHMRWPMITSAILATIGVLTLVEITALNLIWPAALVAGGLWLLYRTLSHHGPGPHAGEPA